MNGMQYVRPKFTLPASEKTSDIKWDLAFLTKEEFVAKHGEAAYEAAQKS